jgi:hypothetical protein
MEACSGQFRSCSERNPALRNPHWTLCFPGRPESYRKPSSNIELRGALSVTGAHVFRHGLGRADLLGLLFATIASHEGVRTAHQIGNETL